MICIQICSNREWRSLKAIFKINEDTIGVTPYGEYISKVIEGKECIFFHSGATKTRSTGACQYAISKWQPKILFVMGTCGGVAESLNKLDIVIADKTAQYDCVIWGDNESPIFYERFNEEIDNSWINFEELSLNVVEGLIATADQDITVEKHDRLKKANVLCADWESGAISHICKINGLKCCILRGITDIPVKDDPESGINQGNDYRKNTPLVMEKLLNTLLPELLNQIR